MSIELPNYENAAIQNELYATAYQMQFYMQRITQNLLNIKDYPNVKQITFVNPNLYDIAAQYYNDADQWTVIAEANDLDTPFLTGTYVLDIPNNPSTSSGGVLNV